MLKSVVDDDGGRGIAVGVCVIDLSETRVLPRQRVRQMIFALLGIAPLLNALDRRSVDLYENMNCRPWQGLPFVCEWAWIDLVDCDCLYGGHKARSRPPAFWNML